MANNAQHEAPRRQVHQPIRIQCQICHESFQNRSGLTQHRNAKHVEMPVYDPGRNNANLQGPQEDPEVQLFPAEPDVDEAGGVGGGEPDGQPEDGPEDDRMGEDQGQNNTHYHQHIDARPCTEDGGEYLPPGTPPQPRERAAQGDWAPFGSRIEFEAGEFLFKKIEMSAGDVGTIMDLWAASLISFGAKPPFANAVDMLAVIDEIQHGDAPWRSFIVQYQGPIPEVGQVPSWMTAQYTVWTRDPRKLIHLLLENEDFDGEIDYVPYCEKDEEGKQRLTNFFSGNWAWRQADTIAEDPTTHGAMFVPVILGSDKTTVSVATGQNEYYPLYLSIGNLHNTVRRAHRNAVHVLAFLAIPHADRKDKDTTAFRSFKRQLYHASLGNILTPLRPGMSTPEVVRCPDAHFRRAVYGIGPNTQDYPEQALAACVVEGWCPICFGHHNDLDAGADQGRRTEEFTEALVAMLDERALWQDYGIVSNVIPYTNDFPRADIHELLSGDLLHQIIKPFKDHLVDWIIILLIIIYGEALASVILDELDRRLATMPPFVGLRHFPQGRRFKQWTGDDTRGLMKVFLAALRGLVPDDVVRAVRWYLEYAYIIRHPEQTDDTLRRADEAWTHYCRFREIFRVAGVREDGFSIPRQHGQKHTSRHTRNFGALYGLCTSITENRHITAVKKPWRRSSRYKAIGQMLQTNARLEKLAAARVDFTVRGMLEGTCLSEALEAMIAAEDDPAEADMDVDDEEWQAGDDEPERDDRGARNAADNLDQGDEVGPVAGANEGAGGRPAAGADEELGDAVDGPQVDAFVVLARRPAKGYPRRLGDLGDYIGRPELPTCVARFIAGQLGQDPDVEDVDRYNDPDIQVTVYPSAVATFYAPGDPSGTGGMRREWIRATPSWRKGPARYDCAYVTHDPALAGFRGLHAVRVRLLFSFTFIGTFYSCALVEWFIPVGDEADDVTGMWVVEPEIDEDGRRPCEIIHLDTVLRAAHLPPVYGDQFIPRDLTAEETLDAFRAYYVNKFVDYHGHQHLF
ncbi:uncharacterized protein C8Q71DRAFT_762915 [Rhodofomes roseus]|uniref:C2H2-type domain-containing protein n=1 Tax=Rhodofomes roseus TaxID=34475 RepID=A0ABQ8KDE4_9APHY|nr:uncharacterized protein C8Q71DRAFT_762915 [Rhodofomes roseus]KAH9835642.1 hypothetical protein C8Q71DRAFT_762915 [Rhodofomes roseus]